MNNSVGVELETEGANAEVKKITVFCEPGKFRNERNIIERAVIAYCIVTEILTPELTPNELKKIINKLSLNLKNYSVVDGEIRYKTMIYDGILMLSVEPK